jgi:hypothetical protein
MRKQDTEIRELLSSDSNEEEAQRQFTCTELVSGVASHNENITVDEPIGREL